MSKELQDVEMPDGTVIQDVPVGTSQSDLIRRYALHIGTNQPSPAELASRQAQSKAAFEANQPSLAGGFASEAVKNAKALVEAAYDPFPGAATGMESPAVAFAGMASPKGIIPSAARASKGFQTVMEQAKDIPINTDAISQIVARAKELKATGSSMPKVVADMARALANPVKAVVTDPNAGVTAIKEGIPYSMGRDFATSAGRLSAAERLATNPPMASQVSKLAEALKSANREVADSVGLGKVYDEAIDEYRRVMKVANVKDAIKNIAKSSVGRGIGIGIGGGLGGWLAYDIARKVLGQ